MRAGKRLDHVSQASVDAGFLQRERRERLAAIRRHARAQLNALPPSIRAIENATQGYPVEVSAPLAAAQQALRARLSHDGRRDDH